MADTYTPGLNLTLPEVGSSRDTWGTKCNANFSTIDDFLTMAMPIGALLDFAGPQAPDGWMICDGRLISRITYSALFAIIGTYWGAGDGSTTFALPPTPGRASIGPGTVIDQNGNSQAFAFAQNAGALSNTIQQAHLPNYAIGTDVAGYHSHGGAVAGTGPHSHAMDSQGYHSHGGATTSIGPHQHTVTLWGWSTVQSQPGGYAVMAQNAGASTFATTFENAHAHSIYGDGSHTHSTWGGDHSHGITGDGNHSHTVWLGGSGSLFALLQPIMVVTKIIYAGQQASTRTMMQLASAPQRRLAAPMRGAH